MLRRVSVPGSSTKEKTMPDEVNPGDDVIIIKGGSLEIYCGKNHHDCLGAYDPKGKYRHKRDDAHVRRLVVKDATGKELFSQDFDGEPPSVEITYK
jgi:hypothetical protein